MGKFTDITKLLEDVLNEASSASNLRILGEQAKGLIQKRTRLGGGVKEMKGRRTRLTKLSDPYKKERKRTRGGLDKTTTPSKSNLTRTGEMLNEIGVKSKKGKVRLEFTSPMAKKKAKWTQDAGREFFNISKPEFKQLAKTLTKKVRKIINKLK